jgi:anaerobic selenocysteine-containing dehydrogenase
METAYRVCPLCEATCGLEVSLDQGRVVGVRGDRRDLFSHGFICPKGALLGELDQDPDRLRAPLIRDGDAWREASWPEAFARIEAGLRPLIEAHGADSVAAYLGNPNVHTMAGGLSIKPLLKALGSRNVFSASTVDQMPKHVSCGLLFGRPGTIPVPDLDRTDFLLMLGANPLESNGSLCTAPDFPGRIKALKARGGRLVVVDPRRTRTAALADRHLPIRPGADAFFLFSLVHTLLTEDLADPAALTPHLIQLDELAKHAADFPPEATERVCGIPADQIRTLARELAAAPTAAVYARIGTTTVEFGTLTSWLVDVLNILTGNLDRPGGAMFPQAPHQPAPRPGPGRGYRTGRWTSRVRKLPEVNGELPVATLADEIETPGENQVRALITLAGNPVLSTPNSDRLDRALSTLEFMVAVDCYLNETTRHADVILPPSRILEKDHYDFYFNALAVRNVPRYSLPAILKSPDVLDECEILARLTMIVSGYGADADPNLLEGLLLDRILAAATQDETSPVAGRELTDLKALLYSGTGAQQRLDAMLRLGAFGDGFGANPDGLTLAKLAQSPHGIDLGPMTPALPALLKTASGKIELCPDPIVADLARLRAGLENRTESLVLIGRRHQRSNNSWMHNVPGLTRGTNRCTLQVHPDDATRLGLADGAGAIVASRVGEVTVPVELTTDVMPGVVSLPHGWGHTAAGSRMSAAARTPGVNTNILTDEAAVDPLSGTAVLNGIPVSVTAATAREENLAQAED